MGLLFDAARSLGSMRPEDGFRRGVGGNRRVRSEDGKWRSLSSIWPWRETRVRRARRGSISRKRDAYLTRRAETVREPHAGPCINTVADAAKLRLRDGAEVDALSETMRKGHELGATIGERL